MLKILFQGRSIIDPVPGQKNRMNPKFLNPLDHRCAFLSHRIRKHARRAGEVGRRAVGTVITKSFESFPCKIPLCFFILPDQFLPALPVNHTIPNP